MADGDEAVNTILDPKTTVRFPLAAVLSFLVVIGGMVVWAMGKSWETAGEITVTQTRIEANARQTEFNAKATESLQIRMASQFEKFDDRIDRVQTEANSRLVELTQIREQSAYMIQQQQRLLEELRQLRERFERIIDDDRAAIRPQTNTARKFPERAG